VVEDRDPGLVVGEEIPVHPHSHENDASALTRPGKGISAAWRGVLRAPRDLLSGYASLPGGQDRLQF
jgi:hypothetical protein